MGRRSCRASRSTRSNNVGSTHTVIGLSLVLIAATVSQDSGGATHSAAMRGYARKCGPGFLAPVIQFAQTGDDAMASRLLQITIFDPGGFQKASSAAAYAVKCAELALAELGRGHGTVMAGDVIGQDPSGATNQTLGESNFTPGPDLPP
jgi:hypothetical protein